MTDVRRMTPKQVLEGTISELGPISEKEKGESYNRILAVLETITDYQDKKVLDIGCSFGMHAIAAAKLGAVVFGVDKFTFPEGESNDFQLTKADFASVENVWANNGATVSSHDLDERLPFADNFFDIVVSNAVIEHLNGTHKKVFDETFRVLKPGGTLLISTPNIAFILKRVRFLIGRSPNWDLKDFYFKEKSFTGHTREFTVSEVSQMVRWAGFHIVSACAKPTYFRFKWLKKPKKYASILSYALGFLRPTLGDHVFVLARKSNT